MAKFKNVSASILGICEPNIVKGISAPADSLVMPRAEVECSELAAAHHVARGRLSPIAAPAKAKG